MTRWSIAAAIIKRSTSPFPWLLAAPLLLSSPAMAQVDTGTILGAVRDQSGAAVANAEVTLTNQDVGISFQTQSNAEGNYQFPALRVGNYALVVQATGFAPAKRDSISLNIQQRYVADFTLQVGAVTETIEVSAPTAQLQTQDASLGGVVQTRTINELPLNGRNYTFLAQLNPGVIMGVPDGRNLTATGSFSSNGQNSFSNNYLLDGVDNNSNLSDFMNGSTYAYRPATDALHEFKVQTSNYSAEFGRAGGAVLNASIKSGSEQFHGGIFEFHRNAALDSQNFFEKYKGLPKGKFIRNQYGGSIGGPIMFLRRGEMKTFFFADYEGTGQRQAVTYQQNVPTALMHQSNFTNFSELLNQGGTRTDLLGRTSALGQIFDPATTRRVTRGEIDPVTGLVATGNGFVRDPFAGNLLPANRLDQNALRLLQQFPLPNKPGLTQNYAVNPVNRDDNHQGDLRIDAYLSSNDTMFYRYSRSHDRPVSPSPFPGFLDGSEFGGNDNTIKTSFHVASWTHIFSPTIVTEMRFGYNTLRHDREAFFGDDPSIAPRFGLQTVDYPGMGGLPTFTVSGLSGFGPSRWVPTWQTETATQFGATTTKLAGNHSLKFGMQYLRPNTEFFQPRAPRGAYFYGTTSAGSFTEVPDTTGGNTGMAQMLLIPTRSTVPNGLDFVGGPNRIEVDNIPDPVPENTWAIWSGFVSDTWKVLPTLSLDLGLRYDYTRHSDAIGGYGAEFLMEPHPRFLMAKGQCNNFLSPSFKQLAATDGIAIECADSNNLVKSPATMFAPRIGIAYSVTNKLVVRTGFGVFYQTSTQGDIIRVVQQNYPFSYGVNLTNNSSGEPLLYGDRSSANFESGIAPVEAQDPTKFNAFNLSLSGIPNPWKMPYSMQYNLTLQRELAPSQIVSVGYVGSASRNGDLGWDFAAVRQIVPPGQSSKAFSQFPSFSSANQNIRGAASKYNSLQTSYEGRLSRDTSLRVNYTFQKCRSQARQGLINTIGGHRNIWVLGPDYGLCGWDAPHAFNASGGFDLPFGRGKHFLGDASDVLNQLVGGWRINVIGTFLSGTPITIPCSVGTTTGSGCHAVLTGAPLYPENQSFEHWLNPAAFANPARATAIGQADVSPLGGPPTQARGPNFRKVDFSIFKNFLVTGTQRVEFRVEIFNLTNTPNFANPGFSTGVTTPAPPGVLDFTNTSNFGKITALRLGQNDQRQIQLALKYYW